MTLMGHRHFVAGRENKMIDREMREAAMRSPKGQMAKFRETLPSFKLRKELLAAISSNQVLVVSGETGCGKTTQVPQFILEEAVSMGRASKVSIVCTQPRRVAAISVAERVANERGERVGEVVGYQVRMDHKLPREQGSILYCTTGILLQRMQSDRTLQQFSHVILDEIHERDIMADLILVIIKQVLPTRPDLKIVLMSATLNATQFSNYLDSCMTIHIPGFMYPVTTFYLEDVLEMTDYNVSSSMDHRDIPPSSQVEDKTVLTEEVIKQLIADRHLSATTLASLLHPQAESLNLDLIATLVAHIHTNKSPGAILVFLPGWEDISYLAGLLTSSFHLPRANVYPLHGSMSPQDQKLIFDRPQPGFRKIVIATNIAESSITIDDIVYVVDSGRAKIKMFDPIKNFATLQPEWISQANAKQRMGRAGRLQPGVVYKMYSKARQETLQEYMAPEMIRSRLENVILKIKVLGYNDVEDFFSQLMDSPSPESVSLSYQALKDIGALSPSTLELTGLGWTLGQLPLDPQLGKMIVLGAAFCCLDPVLSVVTCLDNKSPFLVTNKTKELGQAVDSLASATVSDHLAVANAVAAWEGLNSKGGQARDSGVMEFCHQHFLSQRVLRTMDKMKYQYGLEVHKLGLTPSSDPKDPVCNLNSGCEALVRAVISIGLVPNVATLQEKEDKFKLVTTRGQDLEFHPRSCNRDIVKRVSSSAWESSIPRWFTYFEKMHSSDTFLHDSTAAGPLSLLLLASNISFLAHPSPSSDPSLDPITKKRLGVLFHNPAVKVFNVLVTAGRTGLRLFVCGEETVEKVKRVRRVVDKVLQERFRGVERGKWDIQSEHGLILGRLVWALNSDRA
eukprot:GFUD01040313.1.p1 GENE.GFUD01040313.1~~GFUD01040313.1.p1  ORF type:complete len:850 (-),score=282.83 GFUD01040313.1:55-2604(-)